MGITETKSLQGNQSLPTYINTSFHKILPIENTANAVFQNQTQFNLFFVLATQLPGMTVVGSSKLWNISNCITFVLKHKTHLYYLFIQLQIMFYQLLHIGRCADKPICQGHLFVIQHTFLTDSMHNDINNSKIQFNIK